ncbi:MAG: Crp/Fnr family transcriptional regulator [Pseudomonadota bacterium]
MDTHNIRTGDLISGLASDSLLRALEPDQLADLLRAARKRDLEPGKAIITQGDDTGDFAVFLLSGGLKISMTSASGSEIILNYCSPGELVGEIAMLDSGPRTASVSAVMPSSVLVLPSQTFVEAVLANPASVVGVMRELARRMRQMNLIIESDRTFSMAPRLARAMLRLLDEERGDGHLRYNPSQSDLGAFAGLARENVSRLLTAWEAQSVIERKGRALFVRDRDYLETLAEFGDEG